MKGILVNRNKDNKSQAHSTQSSNGLIFMLTATHKNGRCRGGNHEENHPKVEVFMHPESGRNNRKQGNNQGGNQTMHSTNDRHTDGQFVQPTMGLAFYCF